MCTVCFSAKDSHFWAQASAKLLFFRGEVALNKAIPRKLSPWRFSVGKLLVEESTERAPQKYKRRGRRRSTNAEVRVAFAALIFLAPPNKVYLFMPFLHSMAY